MAIEITEEGQQRLIRFVAKFDDGFEPVRSSLIMTAEEYSASTAAQRRRKMQDLAQAVRQNQEAVANVPPVAETAHDRRARLRRERADLLRRQAVVEDELATADEEINDIGA